MMASLNSTRYLMLMFSIIMFVAGGALLAGGLLFKLDSGFLDRSVVRLFNLIQYNEIPYGVACDAVAYMMMCGGGVMVVVAVLGMVGALKSAKGCLWTFIVLCIIFIIFQGILIGLWISIRTQADLWLRGQMLEQLKSYAGPTDTDTVSDGWNTLFMKARCCGVNAQFVNGGTNSDYTELPTTWTSGTDLVPASCCQGVTADTVTTFENSATCTNTPSNFYTEGCYSRVKFYVDTYSLVTFIAGSVAVIAEVLAIVSACVFIDKTKNRVSSLDRDAGSRPPPYVAIDKWINHRKAATEGKQ